MIFYNDVISKTPLSETSKSIYKKKYVDQILTLSGSTLPIVVALIFANILKETILNPKKHGKMFIVYSIIIIIFMFCISVEIFTFLEIKNNQENIKNKYNI